MKDKEARSDIKKLYRRINELEIKVNELILKVNKLEKTVFGFNPRWKNTKTFGLNEVVNKMMEYYGLEIKEGKNKIVEIPSNVKQKDE